MPRRHNLQTHADLIAELATGDSYSVMAERTGYHNGSNFRAACRAKGLSRVIRNGVVIVIAEPT